MTKQYDVENGILKCWNIKDDLDLLIEHIAESEMSRDEILNILIGINGLYDLKFNKLWSSYEEMIKENFKKNNKL